MSSSGCKGPKTELELGGGMNRFRVIRHLDVSESGPIALGPDGEYQDVHLYQGSIDGACGPYCVFMGLLSLGLIDRSVVTGLENISKKTSLGKLLSLLSQYQGFFREGTDLEELENLLLRTHRTKLKLKRHNGKGIDTRSFIEGTVVDDAPVILRIRNSTFDHWVLVVGIKYNVDDDITGYLVLDPDEQATAVTPWNGVILREAQPGRFPYSYLTRKGKNTVALDYALGLQQF